MIGDRQARIEYGRYNKRHGDGPPSPRRGVKERHEPSPVIYVGNVPHEATKSDILEVMKPLGDAKAVRICALLPPPSYPNYILSLGSRST